MDCCSGKKHEKTGHTEQEMDGNEQGNNNLLILAGAAIAIIILAVALLPK